MGRRDNWKDAGVLLFIIVLIILLQIEKAVG